MDSLWQIPPLEDLPPPPAPIGHGPSNPNPPAPPATDPGDPPSRPASGDPPSQPPAGPARVSALPASAAAVAVDLAGLDAMLRESFQRLRGPVSTNLSSSFTVPPPGTGPATMSTGRGTGTVQQPPNPSSAQPPYPFYGYGQADNASSARTTHQPNPSATLGSSIAATSLPMAPHTRIDVFLSHARPEEVTASGPAFSQEQRSAGPFQTFGELSEDSSFSLSTLSASIPGAAAAAAAAPHSSPRHRSLLLGASEASLSSFSTLSGGTALSGSTLSGGSALSGGSIGGSDGSLSMSRDSSTLIGSATTSTSLERVGGGREAGQIGNSNIDVRGTTGFGSGGVSLGSLGMSANQHPSSTSSASQSNDTGGALAPPAAQAVSGDGPVTGSVPMTLSAFAASEALSDILALSLLDDGSEDIDEGGAFAVPLSPLMEGSEEGSALSADDDDAIDPDIHAATQRPSPGRPEPDSYQGPGGSSAVNPHGNVFLYGGDSDEDEGDEWMEAGIDALDDPAVSAASDSRHKDALSTDESGRRPAPGGEGREAAGDDGGSGRGGDEDEDEPSSLWGVQTEEGTSAQRLETDRSSIDSDGFADMMSGLLQDINKGLAAMAVGSSGGGGGASVGGGNGGGSGGGVGMPPMASEGSSGMNPEVLLREPSFGDGI